MSIIYFCTFLFPAPSFPSPLAVADPGNLGPAQSLLNPTPSVKFYNSIFSDSPQLSSSGLSEIRQTGCCSAAPSPRLFIAYKSWKLQQQTRKRCWTMLRSCHYRVMTLFWFYLTISHYYTHTIPIDRQAASFCIMML